MTKPTPNLEESIEHLDRDLERLDKNIEDLDDTLEKNLQAQATMPTFLRGVVAALGAAIGGAVVIALIVYTLQKLTGVPFVGHYIDRLILQIQQSK